MQLRKQLPSIAINKTFVQNMGSAAFVFFLAKGLLWLVAAWFIF